MAVLRAESVALQSVDDIIKARQLVRDCAVAQGLSLVDQTKLVTAASELARNTLVHGGGGEMKLETFNDGLRRGVRIVFADRGPGIADIEQAMKDGFSTGGGLGLGLGGAKRLVNDFDLRSEPGKGTTVMIVRWK
ncbi:anti-sigma regulatory factor [Nitrospira moscoviensis]|uniref:Serine/threonine-protein kinase RsbT n=1 Tax=Nitrospira moscoviensis TaxID=42253 RepID=A0A0K2GEQ4_NITMO|nr:anti-sigma regulatory factor [Nitrospira moscoviensis]ALA59097.1 Serine/threonine-protein kinase RsbT [Nitrospira moscoviensis]